jgi:hypothetical protein
MYMTGVDDPERAECAAAQPPLPYPLMPLTDPGGAALYTLSGGEWRLTTKSSKLFLELDRVVD